MADEQGEGGSSEPALSFMDNVRCMFYGEQERDAFLVEKKEKEEKKKGMRTRALSLHQQGWSWTKIATELGCHRTTVMRLVHKWQQTGCIGDLPHRRRPRPATTPLAANRPSPPLKASSRWPVESEKPRLGGRSTTVTVRRRLKELRSQLGIAAPPSPKEPPPQEKPQPAAGSTPLSALLAFSTEELGRLLFSDMRVFLGAGGGGGPRVWRLGQPPLLRDFRGVSAAFWVCVSGSGRKGQLLHVPSELTEERYVQILHNGLLPSAAAIYGLDAHRFLFAQDKSSIQASPVVEEFLRRQQVQCVEWPARSPDLNPVDLLWAELEALLPPSQPRGVAELVQMVRSAYDAVDPAYVQWLVAPPRIRSLCRRMLAEG